MLKSRNRPIGLEHQCPCRNSLRQSRLLLNGGFGSTSSTELVTGGMLWAPPSGEEKCVFTINIKEKFGSALLLLDTARVMYCCTCSLCAVLRWKQYSHIIFRHNAVNRIYFLRVLSCQLRKSLVLICFCSILQM